MAKARTSKKSVEQEQQEAELPGTELSVAENPKEGVLFQGVTETMLAEFEQWAEWKVTDVKDKTQIKLLSERLRKLQKARTGVDEIRKDKNDEYQKIIRENNAAAKVVTDRIVAVEDKMKLERERVEKIQEEERLRLEQEKFEARKKRLEEAGATMLEGAIRTLSDEAFEQSFLLAVAQAEQQRILDQQRAEQEAERQRLEQERQERERLQREQEDRIRAEQEAERQRRQKEEDDRREEEARQRAESQRLEDERLASERAKLAAEAAELQRQRDEENRKAEERRLEQERLQRENQERIDAENRRLEQERIQLEQRKQREADAAYERFESDFSVNGESVVGTWSSLYPEIADRINVHVEAARERAAAEAERLAREQAIADAAAVIADDDKLQAALDSVELSTHEQPSGFASYDEESFIPAQQMPVSPESQPAELTPYQQSSLEEIAGNDGVVRRPTGSGKSIIASAFNRLSKCIVAISDAAKEYVKLRSECETNGLGEDAVEAAYAKLSWMIEAEANGWDPTTYTPE